MNHQRGYVSLPLVLALGPLSPLPTVVQDWYVDVNFPLCPGGIGTQARPFCDIMEAVNAASDGDTIHVAPGTYFENVVVGKSLNIVGTGGQAVTIVDGQANGSAVEVWYASATLSGLSLTNGAYNPVNESLGAGLYAFGGSVVLSDCTVSSNGESGILLEATSALMSRVVVEGNTSSASGGGLEVGRSSTARVDRSVLRGNLGWEGGGASVTGGGFFGTPGELLLTNTLISGNTAADGGAIKSFGDLTMVNSLVLGNHAYQGFSGVVVIRGEASLVNVTLSDGNGFGIDHSGLAELSNCILWNSGPEPIVDFWGRATLRHSVVEGGWPGVGNINADPLFVSPLTGDYRLQPGSPCIDAGDNRAVPPEVGHDLEGKRRFIDGTGAGLGWHKWPFVDMGAFEFGNDPSSKVRRH